MNLSAAGLRADPLELFEELELTFSGGGYEEETFRYRLLSPPQIEPGRKYPVVLFLHGAGERGDDNRAQLKYLPAWLAERRAEYPCFVVAPQCRGGRMWVDIDWSDHTSRPQTEPTEQMQVAVAALRHVLEEYPADPRRVYLTGLSMGGYGAWDLAARHPEWFAAVVPICGGGDERQADRLKQVPIWAWHGERDNAVPVERSRAMVRAIRRAGGDPKYSELPGVGHDSWTAAYTGEQNVLSWMFSQQRAAE